jgi:FkbM family methyltransferase
MMAAAHRRCPGWICNHPSFKAVESLAALSTRGIGFIDVGARDGAWEHLLPVAGITDVVAFEPDKDACDELVQMGHGVWRSQMTLPIGLWDREGRATLYHCAKPTNHSLMPVNSVAHDRYRLDKFTTTATSEVPVERLDDVAGRVLSKRDIRCSVMKLDTQGSEYEILTGAQRILREEAVALVVEVSFFEIYSKQKLFSDVERLLREAGFSFYGFLTLTQRSRKTLDKRNHIGRERFFQADAVFLKDYFDGRHDWPGLEDAAILFSVAATLEYYDFALELAPIVAANEREGEALRTLIDEAASFSPSLQQQELRSISELQDVGEAHVSIGRFVNDHRLLWDLNDLDQVFRSHPES